MARILLVEDNEMNRDMLSRRLLRNGHTVLLATDGQQAIDMARAEQPEIVLMDLSLPVIDGWEATRRLRADPATANLRIIALTSHAMSGDRERALAAGCDDYDTKPLDLPRLLGKIAAAVAAMGAPARAAANTLNVLCHRVHNLCLTTGAAGDQTAAWRQQHDGEIAWSTFDIDPLQDRLLREASLPQTDFGVGYLVNSRATAANASLMQPLDAYQAKAPVEAWDDIAAGLVAALTINGKLIGGPVRTATMGLFYNEALLEQRGIAAPPQTLEELVDQAKRLTFRADDGTPVVGMVVAAELAAFPVNFARAFGGDFLTADFKLLPNPEAMEKALTVMADLFKAGALPRSYATTSNDDQATWMQQGRAAFTALPFARYAQLNNKDQSKYPGRIKAIEFPMSSALKGKVPMASVVEFWAMCIPANARDKELAWSFIQAMSS